MSKKEYEKKKYRENREPKREYEKKLIWRKFWTKKRIWKKQMWGKSWTKKRIKKKTNMKKILNQKENTRKTNMRKILKQKKSQKDALEGKECLNKVETFCQQIRQYPYFICIVCHRCLYKHSVRLFKHEKYNILTAELDFPVW